MRKAQSVPFTRMMYQLLSANQTVVTRPQIVRVSAVRIISQGFRPNRSRRSKRAPIFFYRTAGFRKVSDRKTDFIDPAAAHASRSSQASPLRLRQHIVTIVTLPSQARLG